MTSKYRWSERDMLRLAVAAEVSLKSVHKVAAGGSVRGSAGVRIADAVERLAPKEVGA